jgi:hypothetical protein
VLHYRYMKKLGIIALLVIVGLPVLYVANAFWEVNTKPDPKADAAVLNWDTGSATPTPNQKPPSAKPNSQPRVTVDQPKPLPTLAYEYCALGGSIELVDTGTCVSKQKALAEAKSALSSVGGTPAPTVSCQVGSNTYHLKPQDCTQMQHDESDYQRSVAEVNRITNSNPAPNTTVYINPNPAVITPHIDCMKVAGPSGDYQICY